MPLYASTCDYPASAGIHGRFIRPKPCVSLPLISCDDAIAMHPTSWYPLFLSDKSPIPNYWLSPPGLTVLKAKGPRSVEATALLTVANQLAVGPFAAT